MSVNAGPLMALGETRLFQGRPTLSRSRPRCPSSGPLQPLIAFRSVQRSDPFQFGRARLDNTYSSYLFILAYYRNSTSK